MYIIIVYHLDVLSDILGEQGQNILVASLLITNGHESNVANLNPPHRGRYERNMGFKVQTSRRNRDYQPQWEVHSGFVLERIDGPCSFDTMNIYEPPSTYTSDNPDSCEIDHFLHRLDGMHFVLLET